MRKVSLSIGVASLLLLGSCGRKATEAKQPQQPNIIVVLADDLGFGDVSFYGSKTINTPNLDSLAAGGVTFCNAYATSATSTPSRYGLLTGLYPWRNSEAKILPGDAPLIISEDQFTMPKMMQSIGYRTGAIGKWHLGMGAGNVNWNDTIRPGAKEIGFDYSCLIAATNDRVPTVYVENGGVVGLDPNDPIFVDYEKNFEGEPTAIDHPEMLKMQWHHGHNNSIVNGIPRIGYMKGGTAARWVDEDMADYFVGKVRDFLCENQDKPFFLYYGLHEPHVPRAPHQRFAGTSGMGPRGDAIIEADWCVGQLIHNLDSLGLLDNTIILFSSDNGPVYNDGYNDGARELAGEHSATGGLRGGKYSLYDGGTHIPMFVYWKNHIRPARSNALVSQLDFIASMGSLVGAEYPDSLDSQNQLDAWLGNDTIGRDNVIIECQGKLGIREGKYIMIPPYSGPVTNLTGNELGNLPEFGLFDTEEDPAQRTNIADREPNVLERLKAKFFDLTKGFYRAEVEEVELK